MPLGFCIVCHERTSDRVKPFGILTELVPAHHYHDDRSIREAWLDRAALMGTSVVERVPAR